MELLGELHEEDVGAQRHEPKGEMKERLAARVVLFDSEGLLAMQFVAKKGIYKLPGGGVEEGESVMEGLRREALEETGCTIEVMGDIGSVIEHRHKWGLKQTSYCYLAEVIAKTQGLSLTEKEVLNESALVWMPFKEALTKVREQQPTTYATHFITARELLFLERAKELIF